MRRIFTSAIFAAAFVVASFNSFSQTCAFTMINPSPSPGFGFAYNINSGEGFSGTATTMNVFPVNSTNYITTPGRFYFNTNTKISDPIYFKVALRTDGNKTVNVNSFSISIKYGGGVGTIQTCTKNSPGITIPTGTAQTYYFSIEGITMPASTNFQIKFTMDLGNTNGTTNNVLLSGFSIAALENANSSLPVKFQALNARSINSSVSLNWNVASEEDLSGYSVERSNDGRNFSQIAFVNAKGESDYSFVDSKPATVSYYRIKSVDVNGRYGYSTVALVKSGSSSIVIKAFPSPVIKNVSIQHPTAIAGNSIVISSADGRVIKTIIPAAGAQQTDVDLSSAKAGLYVVRFNGANGESETLKILKQ